MAKCKKRKKVKVIFCPSQTLFALQNSFPRPVRIVLILKPESVLQRALEVGYRGIAENCKFKVCKIYLFHHK